MTYILAVIAILLPENVSSMTTKRQISINMRMFAFNDASPPCSILGFYIYHVIALPTW